MQRSFYHKGVGDGATGEARAIPLFDSSSLNQSSNKI